MSRSKAQNDMNLLSCSHKDEKIRHLKVTSSSINIDVNKLDNTRKSMDASS